MRRKGRFQILYRVGIVGERELFESEKDRYDGIVISSHFASFYRNSVPTFLKLVGKPFFFDPVTYAFARDIENIRRDGTLRKSYTKLVDWYGGQFKKILNERQLIPKDFFKDNEMRADRIAEFAAKTLGFQRDILRPQTTVQQSLLKYAELAEETKGPEEELTPMFFVAPYFYFDSTHDPWYKVSIALGKKAREYEKSKLFVPICFSKEVLLEEANLSAIVTDYKGFDGYLVWTSDLDDDEDVEDYLRGLLTFLKLLSGLGKPILLLYGGFFSFLASKIINRVEGHSRGICYGESKDVDSEMAKGGGAPKRYYMEKVFSKLTEAVARAFYSDNPSELCRCSVCAPTWSESKAASDKQRVVIFFDKLDYTSCRKHFMESYFHQIEVLSRVPLSDIIDLLQKYRSETDQLGIGLHGISNLHLSRWASVLSELTHTKTDSQTTSPSHQFKRR